MENLAPRRRFRDPHDLSGITRVSPRRAIPVRETPLEGTRTLLVPKEGDLRPLVTGSLATNDHDHLGARVCGWVSLGLAATLLPGFLVIEAVDRLGGGGPWFLASHHFAAALTAAFFISHFAGFSSQLFSNSQESNGIKGIALCWVSLIMIVVAEWVIALFAGAMA
jgi:hypothetical protein